MAHRGGNNNNNNDDANAPGGGEEDDLAFPVQIGLMPVPVPARHCRAFRTGFCTADPCRDLHLTCPDGRRCRDAQCVLGHPRDHPRRLEPLPDEALRLDQDYLAERFPDGPPREIFQLPPGIEMMMGPLMMGGGMPTFDDAPAPIQALFSQFMEAMASGQGMGDALEAVSDMVAQAASEVINRDVGGGGGGGEDAPAARARGGGGGEGGGGRGRGRGGAAGPTTATATGAGRGAGAASGTGRGRGGRGDGCRGRGRGRGSSATAGGRELGGRATAGGSGGGDGGGGDDSDGGSGDSGPPSLISTDDDGESEDGYATATDDKDPDPPRLCLFTRGNFGDDAEEESSSSDSSGPPSLTTESGWEEEDGAAEEAKEAAGGGGSRQPFVFRAAMSPPPQAAKTTGSAKPEAFPSTASSAAASGSGGEEAFKVGDEVRVNGSLEKVKALAPFHGGWSARLASYLGQEGTVVHVSQKGDPRVLFADGTAWRFHPLALHPAAAPTPAPAATAAGASTTTAAGAKADEDEDDDDASAAAVAARIDAEYAKHRLRGTGPYQDEEDRAAAVACFRQGMRVRILDTPVEWSDGRMTIDDPAPSRRFIGCEGRVLAVKSDDGEANLIYVIPDGCFEEAWLYLPDDLEILTASSERRPTSGPRTAAATSATTAHSEGSHGLSLELQRSALEIARHKRLGTGPYQPPEERAASLARFRAGMRVRILGTPLSYDTFRRKLCVVDPGPYQRFVGGEGLVVSVCPGEANTLCVQPDDETSTYQYLPGDLESLELSSPQRSSTQKRNRTSAASLSSSSLSSASGGSSASAVAAARPSPPPPRSMSPPPAPVVQGLLAVDAKVKVTATSKDELEASTAGHGGWHPAMAETLGKQGVVVDVLTTSGDVQVRFAGKNTHQFNPRALTVTADPPTLVTRLSRVQVIRDQARLESLCAAKGPAGWHALMAPTVGREGMVLSCDAHGDYLVQFEPSWEEKGPEGKGDAVEENEDEEKGSSSSVFKFGGEKRRLSVSFYYPPQALRLVSGGEPTKGARVRVLASKEEVKRMAAGHGGWDDGMSKILGTEGTVDGIHNNGDLRVRFAADPSASSSSSSSSGGGRSWILHPLAVRAAALHTGPIASAAPAASASPSAAARPAAASSNGGGGSASPARHSPTTSPRPSTPGAQSRLVPGARVRVLESVEIVRALSEGHGGFVSDMEPYCGREGTISRQFPSGDIRVRFGEPGAIWAGIEWTYNPLAVRLAGDVPFAPLTLRDAAVGQRVRVSREQEVVVALQAETPGWVPRMRAALGKEGEVAAVDRTPPPRGRGVQVRMDEGGDSWWFHPGALESIIPREARASAAGSPIVSHGGPASPASSPPRPSMQPPPPPPPPPRVAAASKGPPPPATLLANGLIELEPLGAERERPEGVFVYSKPSGGSVVGIVVPDGKTRVQVVDMRPDLWARVHFSTKIIHRLLPNPHAEEGGAGSSSSSCAWQRPKDAWLCMVDEDGRPLWRVKGNPPAPPSGLLSPDASSTSKKTAAAHGTQEPPIPLISAFAPQGKEEEDTADGSGSESEERGVVWDSEVGLDSLGRLFSSPEEEGDGFTCPAVGAEKDEMEEVLVVARDEEHGLVQLSWWGERVWVRASETEGIKEAAAAAVVEAEEGSSSNGGSSWEGGSLSIRERMFGPHLFPRILGSRPSPELAAVLQRWRETKKRRRMEEAGAEADADGGEHLPPWEETMGDLLLLRELLPFNSLFSMAPFPADEDEDDEEEEEEKEEALPSNVQFARLLAAFSMLEREGADGDEHARLQIRMGLLRAFVDAVAPRVPHARKQGLVASLEMERMVMPDRGGKGVEGVRYMAASGRGAERLAVDNAGQFWESNGARRVMVQIPFGAIWSELRLKAEDYGNYSPEILSVAVFFPTGPPGSSLKRKVWERAQIPVVRHGWIPLLDVHTLLAALQEDKGGKKKGSGEALTVEELMRPPLGLGSARGFAVEVEVSVVRNHDHGINSKINCLRVVAGMVATRPGQRDRRLFSYKGLRETFKVPQTGQYRLEAKGASAPPGRHMRGGRGAIAEGVFQLSKGDQLAIVVGGQGRRRESDSGGGGGTFVWLRPALAARVVIPLLVAGGGGGTRGLRDDFDGQDASLTPQGKPGRGNGESGASGGRFGGDGRRAGTYGSGGQGFWATVQTSVSEAPGARGGFGGGGSTGTPGGGGGGGYSGGGGGRGAGGGGSYVSACAQGKALRLGHVGDGELALTFLQPRVDLTALAPLDRLRLALLRRTLRAGVEALALLRAQQQQQQQQGKREVASLLRGVEQFFGLVREAFPSTVFPRQLARLRDWFLALSLRLDRSRWLLGPPPSSPAPPDAGEEAAPVVAAAGALLNQWRVQRALTKGAGLADADALRRAFVQTVARAAMAASTQAFAPGPATRAFLHAANPFAPAPQTLLKALALLLAVPPTAATKTEEEDGTAEAASDFHAQLLGDIAAATEDFVYERLCSAVAPAAAAKGGDDGRAALEEVVQALARCDLLGHQEKTKASAASVTATTAEGQEAAVAPSTTSSTAAPVLPLSRRLLDATRGAWRRLSQPRALRFALLLARAADAALDPFAAPNDEMTAATSWRERVAAVGAVVGRFGCGRDVVYFHEQLLARRFLQGRTRGVDAEDFALTALGLVTVPSTRARAMLEDARASRSMWGGFLSHTLAAASVDDDDEEEEEEEEGETSGLDAATKAALLHCNRLHVLTITAGDSFRFSDVDQRPLPLPPSVGRVLAAYQALFTTSSSGTGGRRRLQILPRLGSVVLTDTATGLDYVVSPAQAVALLAFSGPLKKKRSYWAGGGTTVSVPELRAALGLEEGDDAFLKSQLMGLTYGQAPVVHYEYQKEGFILDPSSPGARARGEVIVRLPRSYMGWSRPGSVPLEDADEAVWLGEALGRRHDAIEAACVRVAKEAHAAAATLPPALKQSTPSSLARRPRLPSQQVSPSPRPSSHRGGGGKSPSTPRQQQQAALPSSSLARESTPVRPGTTGDSSSSSSSIIPTPAFVVRVQQRLLSVPSSLSSCAREEVLAAVQRLINKGYLRRVVSATDGAALYQGGIAYVPASSSTLSTAAVREEQEHRRVSPPAQGPFSPSPLFGACMAAEARGDGSAGWIGNGEDRHEQLEAALGLLRRRVEAVTGVLHVDASTASTLLGRATPAWDVGPVVGAFVDGEGGEDPLTALLHAHNLPSLLVSDGVRRGVRVLVEAADEQEKELCPCCLSEPVAVRFARCGHGACRECVARMASADMEEGRLPLSCLALVEEEGTGAGAGSRPDPRRMHRCPSALTPAALVEAGMGEGEVLLWGFEIPARDRVGSGAAAYCERVVVSAVCAVAEKLEIVAALVAEGREEELVQLQLTTGALDYAVVDFRSDEAARAFITLASQPEHAKTLASVLSLINGGVPPSLRFELGGRRALLELMAAQSLLADRSVFLPCPNPVGCEGVAFLDTAPSSSVSSATKGGDDDKAVSSPASATTAGSSDDAAALLAPSLRCRRCEGQFCASCQLPEHAPAPCSLLLEWERAGGAALLSQEDLESRRLVYETTRRCPRCGTKIERNGGCLHMTCKTSGGRKGCGHQFCWRCLRPWRRETHSDFFSCSLPPTGRAQGAADAFDQHDKKATGVVALRNRALALQRRLRALPPSTPSPSVLSSSSAPSSSALANGLDTDLAIEALDAVQEAAVHVYAAVVAHHYLPSRPPGPARVLRTEVLPLENAMVRLNALVDPTASRSSASVMAGAEAAPAAADAGAPAADGVAGEPAAAAAAVEGPVPASSSMVAAVSRSSSSEAVALELGALRVRLAHFRVEVAPFVMAGLRGDAAGEGGEKRAAGGRAWWEGEGGEADGGGAGRRAGSEDGGGSDRGSSEQSDGEEEDEDTGDEEDGESFSDEGTEESWDGEEEEEEEDDDEGSEGSGEGAVDGDVLGEVRRGLRQARLRLAAALPAERAGVEALVASLEGLERDIRAGMRE